MAAPSLTYTLTNGSTADAGHVMQDLNDILNGITDGTKDLSISALTLAGALTANGHVTLGNASGDDLTITASLASNLVPKTDATYALGSSSIGFSGLYLGRNSQRVRLIPSASTAASFDLTLPENGGTSGYVLSTNGSGTLSWIQRDGTTSAQSASYTITDTDGFRSILVTTGSSDRTITLPTAADNAGRIITIKKVDSGTGLVTINPEGAETIDGRSTRVLGGQYGTCRLQCDGTGWNVLSFADAGTFTLTFTTGYASNQTLTCYYAVAGNVVTLYLNTKIATAHASAPGSNITSSIPTWLTPTQEQDHYSHVVLRDNGAYAANSTSIVSYVTVTTGGNITIAKRDSSLAASNFTSGTSIGFAAFTYSYRLF